MSVHTKSWKINLPITIDQAWDFFSSPNNLKLITPSEMDFKILNMPFSSDLYEGMFISYVVTPLLGIKMNWTTEITHIAKHQYFVDEQRQGPYSIWHHEHHFESTDSGILMTDILHYSLPFGFLGNLVNNVFIAKQIDHIFAYRSKALNLLFK